MRHLLAVALACAAALYLASNFAGGLKSEAFFARPALKSTSRTANQYIQTTTPAPPDICLQDDGSRNIFQFNSTTGDYQFTNCGGVTLTGVGLVVTKGSIITLQQYGPDRRLLARIDNSVHKGTATVQVFSLGRTFTITDRDTITNTCGCNGFPELLAGAVFPPNTNLRIAIIHYVTEAGVRIDIEAIDGRVIILFSPTIPQQVAENTILANGGRIVGKIPRLGSYLVEIASGDEGNFINRMRQQVSVSYAGPDMPVRTQGCGPNEWESNQALRKGSWYLNSINAPLAWDLAGRSALSETEIGIIDVSFKDLDKGLDDFAGRLQNAIPTELDQNGPTHGTAVTALCCATGNNGFANVGVNWWSKLRLFQAKGLWGWWQALADIARAVSSGSKVINLSVEPPIFCFLQRELIYKPLFQTIHIINTFTDSRFLVIKAAGNDQCELNFAIDGLPKPNNVIIVGATNIGDTKASYSNFGSLVDIAAPGGEAGAAESIDPSLVWVNYNTSQVEDLLDGDTFKGTSFAAPLVTGAAALMWSKEPNLTSAQIAERLKATARRPPGYPVNLGAGILNVYKALEPTSSSIVIDGDPSDWRGIDALLNDPADAAAGLDIRSISVTNDNRNVFILIQFAGPPTDGHVSLMLDTGSGTGCIGLLGHNPDYFIAFPRDGGFITIGQITGCSGGSLTGCARITARGSFAEVCVPIDSLRMVTPNTTGFSLSAMSVGPGSGDNVFASGEYLLR